jgi:hypothetical protein
MVEARGTMQRTNYISVLQRHFQESEATIVPIMIITTAEQETNNSYRLTLIPN